MTLEVRDPVVATIAAHVAAATAGVARLHATPWRPGPLARPGGRGVEVERHGDGVAVTVRLVVHRGRPVIDVVRTVQRSVGAEVRRVTGLVPEVVVVVVDLD